MFVTLCFNGELLTRVLLMSMYSKATTKIIHSIDHILQRQVKKVANLADSVRGLRENGAKPNILEMK
jgi:hypothetical protein